MEGWESNFSGQTTGGRWSVEESFHHINYLELLAVFLSLKSFFDKKHGIHVGIRSDNVTTVYYLNEMGGMTSESLNNLAMNIWSWCIDRYFSVRTTHTWVRQCRGRLHVTKFFRFKGMDAQKRYFSENMQAIFQS